MTADQVHPTESTCACGHEFDEHDDGQECQAQVEWPIGSGKREKCACVYFEAAEDESS